MSEPDLPEHAALPANVLDAWHVPTPGPEFDAHVLRRRRRRRIPARIAAAAALGLAAVLGLGLVSARPRTGARMADGRVTEEIGERAVAVLEPGSALAWRAFAGTVRVEQTRGDVFYRVDDGGRFAVETAAGTVTVDGTCFRVEVNPMIANRHTLIGAAVGASVTAAVLVTLYEGRVALANRHGVVELQPGEQALAGADGPPRRVPPDESSAVQTRAALAHDREQQAEIASLRAKIAALESATAAPSSPRQDNEHRGPREKYVDLSKAELAEMAKRCELRIDVPDLLGQEPMRSKLTVAAEREVFDRVVREEHARVAEAFRKLYVDAGGDPRTADALTAQSLFQELVHKSAPGAEAEARRRLSQERAGLASPPEAAQLTHVDRALRLLVDVGDVVERKLATELGPQRAHELRAERGGWGHRFGMDGCPRP